LILEIAQRAKKLLRSWQGLLNTSQIDNNKSSSIISSAINGDTKPRLILKVKFNSPITKRKRDSDHHPPIKRKKTQVIETPIPPNTPISPVTLIEPNSSLPRLKTTQQLLMEMQMSEPNVLSTQTSTVNAILQKKIIDESLHDTVKLDYSALHHGRELNNTNTKLVLGFRTFVIVSMFVKSKGIFVDVFFCCMYHVGHNLKLETVFGL
jgi:hypothetical protein